MTVAQQLEQIFGVSFTEKENILELRQFHENNTFCCNEEGMVIGLCACENDFETRTVPNIPLLAPLQYLNFSDNSSLRSLKIEPGFSQLQHIDLSDCKLRQFQLFDGFKALRWLDLSRNELEQFNTKSKLRVLEYLDLSNNQLSDFKTQDLLPKLPALKSIYLKNNPLPESKRNSVDKVGNCLGFIKDFQQELEEQGIEENREYKVILVGNGGVGKTCLVERLVYDSFQEVHFSTHGVSLQRYDEKDFPYILNIWDFAGQDIYHATHRLFMQSNAIYLLLWDEETRTNKYSRIEESGEFISYENHDLYYWLDYIKPTEGKSSVIITKTKKSENQAAHPDQATLDSIFNDATSMSIDWHQIDSGKKGGEQNGFDRLLALLKMNIELMKRDEQIPRGWFYVRNHMRQLLQQGIKTISLEKFLEITAVFQIKDGLRLLTDWLVPTGVVFYRKNYFDDAIIIDQSWAMDAIYVIFNRKAGVYKEIGYQEGRFTGSDLSRYWKDQQPAYTDAEKELLLNFMLGCELCFEVEKEEETGQSRHVPFEEREFISPQLLSTVVPRTVKMFERNHKERLWVQYRSRSLHYGLIQSFIVKTQYLADLEGIWKYGTLLYEDEIYAKVKGESNLIQVEVPTNGLVMLDKIRNLITKFPRKDLLEWVSLDGKNYVSYDKLVNWKYGTIEADTGVPISTSDLQVFLQHNAQSSFDLPKPSKSNAELMSQIEQERKEKEKKSISISFREPAFDNSPVQFLFLAASPAQFPKISYLEEKNAIEELLKDRVVQKDCHIELVDYLSPTKMWQSIADFRPQIIHFSGHGKRKDTLPDGRTNDNYGLVLHKDNSSEVEYLKAETLEAQFSAIKGYLPDLQLVFLNACYSNEEAKAISRNGILTIGTTQEVISKAAQHFSSSFYRFLLRPNELLYSFGMSRMTGSSFDPDTRKAYVLYYNGQEIPLK